VRLEGLGQLKNSVTSSEIEPATFRLVSYMIFQNIGSPLPVSAVSTLKKDSVCCSEMLLAADQTKRPHNPEYHNLSAHM
jgi:hypothetical protein